MKVDIKQKINESLEQNEFLIELQYSHENSNLQHFIEYINNYELIYNNKFIVTDDEFSLLEIKFEDITMFYRDKKYNYCKTKNGKYRIKSKLYELENMNADFIRISKSCVVNIRHVEKFDISETGKVIIKLDDSTDETVSRRKTRDIMRYLDDRRI